MKCPMCGGIGLTDLHTPNVGRCTKCNGSGEIEPTNEEYIRYCNTEQLARWIVKIVDCDYCPVKQTKCKNNVPCIAQIEKWLKQPHTTRS